MTTKPKTKPTSRLSQAQLPSDWGTRRDMVMNRAQNCCEWCGVKNYAIGRRKENGEFERWGWGDSPGGAKKTVRAMNSKRNFSWKFMSIVLKVTRIDGDKSNNSMSNLKALCHRCYIRHMNELDEEKEAR